MFESKKKLIFVITQGVVGGAQKQVFDLAVSFKNTYEISVAIGDSLGSDLSNKLQSQKIRTHNLKSLKRNVNIASDVSAFFEILKLYKKEKPDIIHLHSSKAGLVGAVAGFIFGIGRRHKPKIVFTAHGWVFKEDLSSNKKKLFIFLSWFSALFQDKIICVSQDDFNQALKYKIAPVRKLYVIHNSVPEVKFLARKKARDEIGKMIGQEIPEESFVITNFGRLYANKGLNYLVEAVKELKEKVILVIFGDGPEHELLQRQVTSNKLQGAVFLAGDVSEVSRYIAAFDEMVLSSVKEGFPGSIIEAGMANVPVVATNVGGIGEIIKNGETGILIEPKNIKALAESILKILNDKEFGQKISANLKEVIIKDFSFKNLIEKTEWVYKVKL